MNNTKHKPLNFFFFKSKKKMLENSKKQRLEFACLLVNMNKKKLKRDSFYN
jgi:hypothetical protein